MKTSKLSDANKDIIPGSTSLGGRYHVVKLIGSGSFGEIFQVEDTKYTGRRMLAAKLEKVEYDPKKKSKLRHEYEIMQKLKGCRFVPRVFHFFVDDDSCIAIKREVMIMELLGESLD